jgi:hypothetical protein
MSDDKKAGLDKAADEAKKPPTPLKDPQVDVQVKPKEQSVPKPGKAPPEKIDEIKKSNQQNRDLAEKVKKNLTDKVKEAVKEAAPGGAPDQFEAAKQAGEDAAGQVNGRKIKKIEINVTEKGGNRESTTEHVPKEGSDPD